MINLGGGSWRIKRKGGGILKGKKGGRENPWREKSEGTVQATYASWKNVLNFTGGDPWGKKSD